MLVFMVLSIRPWIWSRKPVLNGTPAVRRGSALWASGFGVSAWGVRRMCLIRGLKKKLKVATALEFKLFVLKLLLAGVRPPPHCLAAAALPTASA